MAQIFFMTHKPCSQRLTPSTNQLWDLRSSKWLITWKSEEFSSKEYTMKNLRKSREKKRMKNFYWKDTLANSSIPGISHHSLPSILIFLLTIKMLPWGKPTSTLSLKRRWNLIRKWKIKKQKMGENENQRILADKSYFLDIDFDNFCVNNEWIHRSPAE